MTALLHFVPACRPNMFDHAIVTSENVAIKQGVAFAPCKVWVTSTVVEATAT